MHADHPQFTPRSPDTERRVETLLQSLTLDEKILLLGGHPTRGATHAIERAGVIELKMADGPMGVHWWCDRSTAYPALIMAAACWDSELWERLGKALGRDCRARGVHLLLAPGLNIYRSPLCGRNFEYAGEDPFLAARVGVHYVRGVQSMGVSCTVKHYALNFQEYDRHNVSSDVDERTLHEVYLPAFKAVVTEGGVGGLMTAYNLVNGVHCSEHDVLINQILKKAWGFEGVVMSDWVSTYDAVAAANGGLDLEMPTAKFMNREKLRPALSAGKVSEQTLDDKVRRLLRLMVCFGWLDRDQHDSTIPLDDPETAAVALEVARRGVVLLKNDHEVLPFSPDRVRRLAVLGPYAHPAVFSGGGSAFTPPHRTVSVLDGIRSLTGTSVDVLHVAGPEPHPERQVFATSRFETADGPGLLAEYFNNSELVGSPTLTRQDVHLDFRWSFRTPHETITEPFFSVRWSGHIRIDQAGSHRIYTRSYDSACRVWLDDALLVDTWDREQGGLITHDRQLDPGLHRVTLEWKKTRYWGGVQFGWERVSPPDEVVTRAIDAARSADAAVVCVGFDQVSETEGADRSFAMNDRLTQLVREVSKVQPNTVVVLFAGGNVDMQDWLPGVAGLVHAFYPGQAGGQAIAEVLFGKINPSGKLPATFERRLEDRSSFDCYHDDDGDRRVALTDGIFTGYRHFDRAGIEPAFPFGFGLSYTTFAYENLELTPTSGAGVKVAFDVINTGKRAGTEVAQVYVRDEEASLPRPLKELKGFASVSLEPGERRRVSVDLDRSAFEYYDPAHHSFVLEPGDFEILVGASAADVRVWGRVELG